MMFSKSTIWKFCFLFVLISSILLYSLFIYSDSIEKIRESTPYNLDLYRLIDWLKENTKESDVVLTQWTLAPFIYGMTDRRVIATTKVYPSEVAMVAERYIDLAKFFFSSDENKAFEIIKKYNVTYVVVPKKFDFNNCGYIKACSSLSRENEKIIFRLLNNSNLNNFKLVYISDWFKVYKVLPYHTNQSLFDININSEIKKYSELKIISKKDVNIVGIVIPHDISHATKIIVENLALVGKNYDRVIIIGPDHLSIAGYPITTSSLSWQGFSYYINPDLATITNLGIPTDNGAHKFEWSIRTLIPFITYWQKNSTIVPILFRYDVSYDEAVNFGEKLAKVVDNKTLMIASIDFSHIIPANEKINAIEDNKSLKVLLELRKQDIYSLTTEGKPALVTFLTVMEKKSATNVRLLNISSQSYPDGTSTKSVGYISLQYSK